MTFLVIPSFSQPQFPAFFTARANKKWLLDPRWLLLFSICALSSYNTSQHRSSVTKGEVNWCANPPQPLVETGLSPPPAIPRAVKSACRNLKLAFRMNSWKASAPRAKLWLPNLAAKCSEALLSLSQLPLKSSAVAWVLLESAALPHTPTAAPEAPPQLPHREFRFRQCGRPPIPRLEGPLELLQRSWGGEQISGKYCES